MFVYEKRLQYPIKIKNTNPKLAALIISQYGGPYSNKLRYPGRNDMPGPVSLTRKILTKKVE